MKKLVYLAVFALTLGVCSMAKAVQLVDVPEGHWAEDAVQMLVDEGLVVGYPDGTYRGDRPMTRYEYAMIVARMMDYIEENYCNEKTGECSGPGGTDMSKIQDLLDKLAAEFKDELAALKKQVDDNSDGIDKLNSRIDNLPLGNVQIDGWIRQRVDTPNSDLDATRAGYLMNVVHGVGNSAGTAPAAGTITLDAGYEFYPAVQFKDANKDNSTEWQITLSRVIRNSAWTSDQTDATAVAGGTSNGMSSELTIEDAWVSLNFSEDVRELDLFKLTTGYQPLTFGYYGALVDNRGVDSTMGFRLDLGKDIVELNAFGGLANVQGANAAGLGSSQNDPYAAIRLNLDLSPVKVGLNYLATGWNQEKGWGVDFEADLLQNTPFLKKLRGEYFTITDDVNGATTGSSTNFTNNDDSSYILGLDLYQTDKAGVTVSYADIPAIPVFTGVDISPYSEYDSACAANLGLDVNPGEINAAGNTNAPCYNREDSNVIFPAGFKGMGVEASYIVFGDVTLSAMGVFGDFAGGTYPAGWSGKSGTDPEGNAYPGYGKLSISKPISKMADFKVEYMQQGSDPVIFNRVRGELLLNF